MVNNAAGLTVSEETDAPHVEIISMQMLYAVSERPKEFI